MKRNTLPEAKERIDFELEKLEESIYYWLKLIDGQVERKHSRKKTAIDPNTALELQKGLRRSKVLRDRLLVYKQLLSHVCLN